MSGVHVVLMTAPDRATAERLAEVLVRERLAACATLVPAVTSVFWWEDQMQLAEEVLVMMKTPPERVEELIARAAELHPYDVPELLSLSVEAGLAAYVEWVGRECRVHGPAGGPS